jgi:probable rRNA maturation factor
MTIPTIQFHLLKAISLRDRMLLKAFLRLLFQKEKVKLADLQYIFCSDDRLLEINKQFLNHDYYTDIITFNLSEANQPINAEIYISVDRVRENAREFSSSLQKELHRVIFHGALHLCGYKDKTAEEQKVMREMEDLCINRYFIRSTENRSNLKR